MEDNSDLITSFEMSSVTLNHFLNVSAAGSQAALDPYRLIHPCQTSPGRPVTLQSQLRNVPGRKLRDEVAVGRAACCAQHLDIGNTSRKVPPLSSGAGRAREMQA